MGRTQEETTNPLAVEFSPKLKFESSKKLSESSFTSVASKTSVCQSLRTAKENFRQLLINPTGKFAFSKFLEKENLERYLEFWVEVEKFRSLSTHEFQHSAVGSIYSDFIHLGVPKQIDFPKKDKENVIDSLKRPKITMFDRLQNFVFDFLFNDAYGRFVFVVLQRKAQLKLKLKNEKNVESNFVGLGDCFCLTDPVQPDNPIVGASEGFIRVTGYTREDIIPHNCRFLQGEDTDREVVRRIGRNIREGKEVTEFLLNYRKDGTPFWNLLYITPLKDEQGKTVFFLGGQVDVTKNINNNSVLKEILECADENSLSQTLGVKEKKGKGKANHLSDLFGKKIVPISRGLGAESDVVNENLDVNAQKSIFLETYGNFLIFETKNKTPAITFVSKRFTEITGFSSKDVIGKGPKFFQGPLTSRNMIAEWKVAMKENMAWSKRIICYDAQSLPYWNNAYLTPIKNSQNKTIYQIMVMKWEEMSGEEIQLEQSKIQGEKERANEDCFVS